MLRGIIMGIRTTEVEKLTLTERFFVLRVNSILHECTINRRGEELVIYSWNHPLKCLRELL
jgi:hypothetical protein